MSTMKKKDRERVIDRDIDAYELDINDNKTYKDDKTKA